VEAGSDVSMTNRHSNAMGWAHHFESIWTTIGSCTGISLSQEGESITGGRGGRVQTKGAYPAGFSRYLAGRQGH